MKNLSLSATLSNSELIRIRVTRRPRHPFPAFLRQSSPGSGTIARTVRIAALAALFFWLAVAIVSAQEPLTAAAIEQSGQQAIPSLVRFQGSLAGYGAEKLVLRLTVYSAESSRDPLWSEEQLVQLGAHGDYSLLLGAGSEIGLPQALFTAGEPRWLAVFVGDRELSRTPLTSVPYAMKAADADSLAGQPAANFVTQRQLAERLRNTAVALAEAAQPIVAPAGSGIAGYLPIWTGASTLGDSALFQAGSGSTAKLGIGLTNPYTTLDVNGLSTFRGKLNLFGPTATAARGGNSPSLQFTASSFKAGNAAVSQSFYWQALPVGNNTAAPSSRLALFFAAGAKTATLTGLSIAPNGMITFAPGQSFPFSVTDFPKGVTIDSESFMTGNSTDWMLVATNTSASSKGTILGQATATGIGVEGASPGGVGVRGASDNGTGVSAQSTTSGYALTAENFGSGIAAYLWSQNSSGPAVLVNNVAGGLGLKVNSNLGGAISATSAAQTAIAANSTTGAALSAAAITGYAGLFANNSTYQATVYASNSGNGNAGSFNNNSASRVALAGVNASIDGNAIGTYGSASNGKAVYGVSATGNGIYGTSTNGVGVVGNSSTAAGMAGYSGTGAGTYGSSTSGAGAYGVTRSGIGVNGVSATGVGVFGQFDTISGTAATFFSVSEQKAGVLGDAGSGSNIGVVGTGDDTVAGAFLNNSQNYDSLIAFNSSDNGLGPTGLFRVFQAGSPNGACGIGGGGNLSCTGQLKSLVAVAGGARNVETYSIQSPENWIEDFGSGSMKNGVASVSLDPGFAETVSGSADYHVFLTPSGDSKGLYVSRKTASGFEVRESGGGKSSIAFDYRIVAKRHGHESERLVDVTEQLKVETAAIRPRRK